MFLEEQLVQFTQCWMEHRFIEAKILEKSELLNKKIGIQIYLKT